MNAKNKGWASGFEAFGVWGKWGFRVHDAGVWAKSFVGFGILGFRIWVLELSWVKV